MVWRTIITFCRDLLSTSQRDMYLGIVNGTERQELKLRSVCPSSPSVTFGNMDIQHEYSKAVRKLVDWWYPSWLQNCLPIANSNRCRGYFRDARSKKILCIPNSSPSCRTRGSDEHTISLVESIPACTTAPRCSHASRALFCR